MQTERSLLFITYGEQLPSFRYRSAATCDILRQRGWQVSKIVLPQRRYVRRIWAIREALAAADVVVLSKLKLSSLEAHLLRRYARRIVYDFDDAIWLRRPRSADAEPGRSRWREGKVLATASIADAVICGNQVLAAFVQRRATALSVLPTPVDAQAYPELNPALRNGRTLVWVGLPNNMNFLEPLLPVLRKLETEFPGLRLRLVTSEPPAWLDSAPLEFVAWSGKAEKTALANADIGIMPLHDDDWARGKCAFKLLQYMAAALPVVGSPVGMNAEVVRAGVNGFPASALGDWEQALRQLLGDEALRLQYGRAGRDIVLAEYAQEVLLPQFVDVYERAASAPR